MARRLLKGVQACSTSLGETEGAKCKKIAKRILAGEWFDHGLIPPEELFSTINRETAETLGLTSLPTFLEKVHHVYSEAGP